jgi:hypothetical protein
MNCRFVCVVLLAAAGCHPGAAVKPEQDPVVPSPVTLAQRIQELKDSVTNRTLPFTVPFGTRVDTVIVDSAAHVVTVDMSREFSYVPYREESVLRVREAVARLLQTSFACSVRTLGKPLEELIPNVYRSDMSRLDRSRLPVATEERPSPVVRRANVPWHATRGLAGRNIVLSPSHGWYYNNEADRWEWQRPRLFRAVEDVIPLSFTLPYLVPMLEHAGANVFVSRERDTQLHEVVIDNDSPRKSMSGSYAERGSGRMRWTKGEGAGFAVGAPPYANGTNPFVQGTYRTILADTTGRASITWTPRIPEPGVYAVYVSYHASRENADDARYIIHHAGGTTEYLVNQTIGGGTWEYLGTFTFRAGRSGKVVLSNRSATAGARVTADAVRFGGGMGVIERGGAPSGRPKYVEGSRYYLQYAGMPDSLVYNLNGDRHDYRDDYQSRGEYANYLRGTPAGPNRRRTDPGLGIPVDLSLAFHTDAGITDNDTTIGTLALYTLAGADSAFRFPDSMSRWANRDFADIVQTQIVDDLRALYDPAWTRRDLKDADYSESSRPNMPSMLLELLSHQNFLDMKYVLDPRFRFDVARAIYKGMLRFIAGQHRLSCAIAPLGVTNLSSEFTGKRGITLRWEPSLDPLESTAAPDRYMVYTRLDDGGFDNGMLVSSPTYEIKDIRAGVQYSFMVTAVNDGGESLPSEIVSACLVANSNKKPVLIVNGFQRIAGPAAVDAQGFRGFLDILDAGVADRTQFNFTGEQYDFDPASPFRSNDGPGHGASGAENEATLSAGNSFDYPFVHGRSLKECGRSFVSASVDAVMDTMVDLAGYPMIDLILGEQRETRRPNRVEDSLRGTQFTTFPAMLQRRLREYCSGGGNLFVSGAYIGSDPATRRDSASIAFCRDVLKLTWITGHAARTGRVKAVGESFLPKGFSLEYCAALRRDVYAVEAPDAIAPAIGGATILRYAENLFSAGVASRNAHGVVALGFPFETILDAKARHAVMSAVLRYFRQ